MKDPFQGILGGTLFLGQQFTKRTIFEEISPVASNKKIASILI